jgi:hypothetical protein
MASVSPYMLRNFYVDGSLQNTDDGFQFMLKNVIDSGTLLGLAKLEVDDKAFAPEEILVGKGEAVQKASEISHQKPLYFHYGQTLTIKVLGEPLESGSHEIRLTVNTAEIGRITLPIEATL